jgi:hypothetical protein
MKCPVCDELYSAYKVACQAEAIATLEQRYHLILGLERKHANRETTPNDQESILSCRQRQLKIASWLEEHNRTHHSVTIPS